MEDKMVSGALRGRKIDPETGKRNDKKPNIPYIQRMEVRTDGKANCMTSVPTDSLIVEKKTYKYRQLSCIEAERLQTLPDNYTAGESNCQRFRMIGNGWNVETIMVFFDALKVELMRRKVAA